MKRRAHDILKKNLASKLCQVMPPNRKRDTVVKWLTRVDVRMVGPNVISMIFIMGHIDEKTLCGKIFGGATRLQRYRLRQKLSLLEGAHLISCDAITRYRLSPLGERVAILCQGFLEEFDKDRRAKLLGPRPPNLIASHDAG